MIEHEKAPEFSLHACLERVGISRLSDWDVLAFVYRRGVSLTSAEQIARLVGHESSLVAGALERLERDNIIQRSRPSRGARFYRFLPSTDAGCRRCLGYLVSLLESRAGRLLLTRRLSLRPPGGEREPSSKR